MLKSLHISNFALIDKIELEFCPTLNIITGETGAGKSIIVDALMTLFGSRISPDTIRKGAKKAVIEGEFDIDLSDISAVLNENEIEAYDNLIIRREITEKGSRCFVCDTPCTVALLKQLGNMLVDFHGQHEHQSLLDPATHIAILDRFAGNEAIVADYRNDFKNHLSNMKLLEQLKTKEEDSNYRLESYRFELNQILKVAPERGEEDSLENELKIIENSEMLYNLCSELNERLSESDSSVRSGLALAQRTLAQLSKIDSKFEDFNTELSSVSIALDEVINFTASYINSIHFDPERIETIRQRLVQLKGLRKKYGSENDIFDRIEFLQSELDRANSLETQIVELEKKLLVSNKNLTSKAIEISKRRKEAALNLDGKIIESLNQLGFGSANFATNICIKSADDKTSEALTASLDGVRAEILPDGVDVVEFFLSANKGEEMKSLSAVASGGEISRIMLAIKSAIARSDSIPMMIFDEIDTGISGRIAQKVGSVMRMLADSHQIIAITHLPQIAAFSAQHIALSNKKPKVGPLYRRMFWTATDELAKSQNCSAAKMLPIPHSKAQWS